MVTPSGYSVQQTRRSVTPKLALSLCNNQQVIIFFGFQVYFTLEFRSVDDDLICEVSSAHSSSYLYLVSFKITLINT